jgi:hypothetical protein
MLVANSVYSLNWFKIITIIGSGGVAQVVEHLPSKCEALSSKPSTTKKKSGKNNYY